MFINPYSIDLNADRCIYQEPGRQYIITLEDGHHYNGSPLKIVVDGESVHYDDKSGTILTFSLETFRPGKVRGSIGEDSLPLIDLSFESCFPHLAEQIKYSWPPIGITKQLFPE